MGKVHYAKNLHEALCGSGWIEESNDLDQITCEECKRIINENKKTILVFGGEEHELKERE